MEIQGLFEHLNLQMHILCISTVIQKALQYICSILVCVELVRRLFMWICSFFPPLPSSSVLASEALAAAVSSLPRGLARLSQANGYLGCTQLCHNCPPHEFTTAVISHAKPY